MQNRRLEIVIIYMVLMTIGVGCAPQLGTFDSLGFHASKNPYSISYTDGNVLLSKEWLLRNFTKTDNGQPNRAKSEGVFVSTIDWAFSSGITKRIRTITYELLYNHRRSNGVIWVRVLPIPRSGRGKSTNILAQNLANAINGTVYNSYLSNITERRVATKIISQEWTKIASKPAYAIVFDTVNLDQLQMDSNAPRTRSKIILVADSFRKEIGLSITRTGMLKVPARLFLGYSNDASQFETHLADFDDLAKRIVIERRQ